MDDLVKFLRDRYDEDEQTARNTEWATDEGLRWFEHHSDGPWALIDEFDEDVATVTASAAGDEEVALHIARHDPARVLADVEAKRQIIRLHTVAAGHECSTLDRTGDIDHCTWVMESEACTTLRLLALPYADHPEYQETWAVAAPGVTPRP